MDGWMNGATMNDCVPLKYRCRNLSPNVLVLGGGPLGGDSVTRVEPS